MGKTVLVYVSVVLVCLLLTFMPGTSVAAAKAPTYSISLSASSIQFGNTNVGSSSYHSMVLYNPGSGSITVSKISSSNAQFAVHGFSGPATVSAGQSLDFSVSF